MEDAKECWVFLQQETITAQDEQDAVDRLANHDIHARRTNLRIVRSGFQVAQLATAHGLVAIDAHAAGDLRGRNEAVSRLAECGWQMRFGADTENAGEKDWSRIVRDGFATVKEAATYLGLSTSKIYEEFETGRLAYAKFGRSRRVAWRSLFDYAEAAMVDPTNPRTEGDDDDED